MTRGNFCILFVLFSLAVTTTASAKIKPKPKAYPATGFYLNGNYANTTNINAAPAIEMVNSATSTLDIEIYTMEDANFRAAVSSALSRGVKINVVKEPNPDGVTCAVFSAPKSGEEAYCAPERALFAQIKAAGGTVVPFNKANLCGTTTSYCYEHGKMLIVDNAIALVSTGNFDPTSLCDVSQNPGKCDRDYSMITDDATILGALEEIFAKDLVGNAYDLSTILTPAVSAKMTVSPDSLQPIISYIQSAKKSIVIQNQYLEDTTMNSALEAAAKSGVKVSVMVESVCAFGTPTASEKSETQTIYEAFDSAGVKSSFFTGEIKIFGQPGYLHAKNIVVDGDSAWVGSVNGSSTALSTNREFGLFITDQSQIASLSQTIEADAAASGAETWEESIACTKDNAIAKAGDLTSLLSLNSY